MIPAPRTAGTARATLPDMPCIVFAYGSNLCPVQMAQRVPGSAPLGKATLEAHRLAFVGWSGRWYGGVATAEHAPLEALPGALWELPPGGLAILDGFEGVAARSYDRNKVTCLYQGDPIDAWMYQATYMDPNPPSPLYRGVISRGAGFHGIGTAHVKAAVSRAKRDARAFDRAAIRSPVEPWERLPPRLARSVPKPVLREVCQACDKRPGILVSRGPRCWLCGTPV